MTPQLEDECKILDVWIILLFKCTFSCTSGKGYKYWKDKIFYHNVCRTWIICEVFNFCYRVHGNDDWWLKALPDNFLEAINVHYYYIFYYLFANHKWKISSRRSIQLLSNKHVLKAYYLTYLFPQPYSFRVYFLNLSFPLP